MVPKCTGSIVLHKILTKSVIRNSYFIIAMPTACITSEANNAALREHNKQWTIPRSSQNEETERCYKIESQLETKIFINDCTVESFRFIQRFFYGLNPILNESIIVDILYVSKKYLITSLEQGCVEYISSITDIEAVLTI
eukprot:202906_1